MQRPNMSDSITNSEEVEIERKRGKIISVVDA